MNIKTIKSAIEEIGREIVFMNSAISGLETGYTSLVNHKSFYEPLLLITDARQRRIRQKLSLRGRVEEYRHWREFGVRPEWMLYRYYLTKNQDYMSGLDIYRGYVVSIEKGIDSSMVCYRSLNDGADRGSVLFLLGDASSLHTALVTVRNEIDAWASSSKVEKIPGSEIVS